MDFLERGLNWSTVAYIVFVCLAAAASFLLALFAGRVASVRNEEIRKLQSKSAEAVAHAQAGAARAHAQAELAYQERRRLEADVALAEAHHELLRKENLKLQLTVEEERIQRLRLEEQLGPRHIDAAQRRTIQSELSGFQGQRVSIITHPGDPEIAGMANEIKTSLLSAGIAVTLAPALVFGRPQTWYRPGRGTAPAAVRYCTGESLRRCRRLDRADIRRRGRRPRSVGDHRGPKALSALPDGILLGV